MKKHNILLNRSAYKKAVDKDSAFNVALENGRKLLPVDDVVRNISQYERYETERARSNKVRLTFVVNPICSNVLFNRITEVIKDEGSSAVTVVNYGEVNMSDVELIGKKSTFYTDTELVYHETKTGTSYKGLMPSATYTSDTADSGCRNINAVRDTQISQFGYDYKCGTDFMNNHLVRSLTFRNVNKNARNSNATSFNTIADTMRNYDGSYVVERASFPISSGIVSRYQTCHIYNDDNIMSFSESVVNNIIEQYNGWFGFYNRNRIRSYDWSDGGAPVELKIYKPLMDKEDGGFVDMYPGRDMYSFIPKYNKARHRLEKNWNYCITYPSSSTTDGFDNIFVQTNQSMRALYFDENTISNNGSTQLIIYSIAKHGLSKGDHVNVYVTDVSGNTSLAVDNATVSVVVNDYVFAVPSSVFVSSKWVTTEVLNNETVDGQQYLLSNDGKYYYKFPNLDVKYYILPNDYVNIDDEALTLSYKKVVGNLECEYYVRIFSKLPNFKFYSGYTGECDLYARDSTAISDCQDLDHAFESQVSKLAFSENIYGDGVGQIVFTDDVDTSNLRDNLGRPLTSIFLTVVKNNMGYKEWYGYDSTSGWTKSETKSSFVEYSHCFGKVTCGLELSEEARRFSMLSDIKKITNIDSADNGLDVSLINGLDRPYVDSYGNESDLHELPYCEVWFNSDKHFYGDVACYDEYNAIETSLQPVLHRFNTAQRESCESESDDFFSKYAYDEIISDDYDKDMFKIKTLFVNNANRYKEGYYYQPHYEIKIKSFGEVNTVMPDFLRVRSLVNVGGNRIRITTSTNHYLTMGDVAVVYDRETGAIYNCTTVSGKTDSYKTFTCAVTDERGKPVYGLDEMLRADYGQERYKLVKTDNIPYHAKMMRDGTCRYAWRDIYQNGMGGDDEEVYPFTNGALYIHKNIDIFVKRQDFDAISGLYSADDAIGVEEVAAVSKNNYVKEDDIEC